MESIKQYLKFVKPYIWSIIATVLIGGLKFAIPLLIPLILKYVIDTLNEGVISLPDQVMLLFWLMVRSFIVFILLRPPVEYYLQYFSQITASKILYDIRYKLFFYIQRLSLKYYTN